MIRLWNIKQLSDDLASGTVSEREKVDYVIFSSILLSAVLALTANFPTNDLSGLSKNYHSAFEWMSFIVEAGFALVFYSIIAKANQEIDGKNLIERIICLSLPAVIRALVLMLIPAGVLAALVYKYASHSPIADAFASLIVNILSYYFFYSTLKYWVLETAKKTSFIKEAF
jgi:hypothetical protein